MAVDRSARRGREGQGPGRTPVFFTLGLHVLLLLLVLLTNLRPVPVQLVAIELELVSMPAPESEVEPAPSPEEEELTVDTPEPEPVPEEELEAVVEREQEPEPEPRPDAPEPELEVQPLEEEAEPAPMDEPSTGTDDLNVRMRGVERDFPQYYANMQRQLRRCFRPPGRADLTASIDFVLDREGKVLDETVRISETSRSLVFDLAVMEALECAGGGRFGPLPPEMQLEHAPFRFTFSPSRRPPAEAPPEQDGSVSGMQEV